jgi:hypothetical protein
MATPVIALLVTGEKAFEDFKVFVKSLEVWHPDAVLYVQTDSPTAPLLAGLKTKMTLRVRATLDRYKGLTRSDMEALPGVRYDSLFKEYTYEKATVLEEALAMHPQGVWFQDADIVHLAPLPAIPEGATVALSPHAIRPGDERLYGRYNAGYLWIKDPSLIIVWREAGARSRFFEQAALEDVATAAGTGLYEFPLQVNFGWWRMYQGAEPPSAVQARFGFNRMDRSVGLRFNNAPLQSIHTHLYDKSTGANGVFNKWLDGATAKFASHPALRSFRKTCGFN